MIAPKLKQRPGVSVIEVLIALGIAAVVIASVGNLVSASHRLNNTAALREHALGYARGSLEAMNELYTNPDPTTNQFAYKSPTANGIETCTPSTGNTVCWTEHPDDLSGANLSNTNLHLVQNAGRWELRDGAEQPITGDANFSRSISITNLDPVGSPNFNRKKVTVTISWTDQGQAKQLQISDILTAWQSL